MRVYQSQPLETRFWARVDKKGEDECWPWTGTLRSDGYGQIDVVGQGSQPTARIAWELTMGPIPSGLWVLHKCDNPPCCNPQHLFLGTHADNMRDMINKGRSTKGKAQKRVNPNKPYTPPRRQANRSGAAMSKLTPARVNVLFALQDYLREHGYPPSVRDIAIMTGKAKTTVSILLKRLERDGLVTHEANRARTWRIVGES